MHVGQLNTTNNLISILYYTSFTSGVQICALRVGSIRWINWYSDLFQQIFVKDKVTEWMKELETLITVAQTQPHAAYASFTHGVNDKREERVALSSNHWLDPLQTELRTVANVHHVYPWLKEHLRILLHQQHCDTDC